MPRKPRVEYAGYHHLINRGVARQDIFLKDADYERFLEILEHTADIYNFNVHSLCLMPNHYHLLIETKNDNLSLLARQINSKYAQYFNREYKRVGPLWQGRFKSYFVHDEVYLDALVRYIEQNPVKAKISETIGTYAWSASTLLKLKKHNALLEHSLLQNKAIATNLERELSLVDDQLLHTLFNTTYKKSEEGINQQKCVPLTTYFHEIKSLKERNKQILLALKDGYKQSEVARYLNVTSALISHVSRHAKSNSTHK